MDSDSERDLSAIPMDGFVEDWQSQRVRTPPFTSLIRRPNLDGWSERKRAAFHCAVMRLLRVEEEIDQSDLDYNLLCKHMNLLSHWIGTWDDLQRIEYTYE